MLRQPGHAPAAMSPTTESAAKSSAEPAAPQDAPTSGAYAIVEASGQQFWLQPNRYYDLDRLGIDVDTIGISLVILIGQRFYAE